MFVHEAHPNPHVCRIAALRPLVRLLAFCAWGKRDRRWFEEPVCENASGLVAVRG
jgi:hypothetical protein